MGMSKKNTQQGRFKQKIKSNVQQGKKKLKSNVQEGLLRKKALQTAIGLKDEILFKNLLSIYPKWPSLHREVGLYFLEIGKFKEAQKHLEQAYDLFKESPATIKALITVYSKVNDRKEIDTFINKAVLHLNTKNLDFDLITLYKDILKIYPYSKLVSVELGLHYLKEGDDLSQARLLLKRGVDSVANILKKGKK